MKIRKLIEPTIGFLKKYNTGLKWFLTPIFVAIIGFYAKVYYDEYKKREVKANKPIVVIQQNNPHPQNYELSQIELPFIIQNLGKTRANNVKLNLFVPNSAYVWFSSEKFTLIKGDNDGIKVDSTFKEKHQKFLEFSCSRLDTNEIVLMNISVDRARFVRENNLKPLRLGFPIPSKNQKFPSISSITFNEGVGTVNYRDSLILNIATIPNAKVNYTSKLENGYNPNDTKLQLLYTNEFIEDLIRQSEYVFKMLQLIKLSLDSNDDLDEMTSINQLYVLPSLPFLKDFQNDSTTSKYTSYRFKAITEDTQTLKKTFNEIWENSQLNKSRAERIIKYYFNQIELYRILLNVENSWLKGKTTKEEHDEAFDRYVWLNNIKNQLPIRPIEFNEDAFYWKPTDSILANMEYKNGFEL